MLERFQSPFPDGPDTQTSMVERYLRQLESAGVDVQVGGKLVSSKELLNAAGYADVIAYFWSGVPAGVNELNDVGCAYAWDRSWDEAKAKLEASMNADGADGRQKKRAKANLALVDMARRAEGS